MKSTLKKLIMDESIGIGTVQLEVRRMRNRYVEELRKAVKLKV